MATVKLKVGNKIYKAETLPDDVTTAANERIQKKVQPVIDQIRIRRRLAIIAASKIVFTR